MSFLLSHSELYAQNDEEHAELVVQHATALEKALLNTKKVFMYTIIAIAQQLEHQRFKVSLIEKDNSVYVFGTKYVPSNTAPELDRYVEPIYRLTFNEKTGNIIARNISISERSITFEEQQEGRNTWLKIQEKIKAQKHKKKSYKDERTDWSNEE